MSPPLFPSAYTTEKANVLLGLKSNIERFTYLSNLHLSTDLPCTLLQDAGKGTKHFAVPVKKRLILN